MAEAWQTYPNAPQPGQRVCALSDLTAAVLSVDLNGFPLILIQSSAGLRGYVNACPHQYLPLDWRSSRILSADGALLRCSNHDAGFDATTGEGVDGLGTGCALDPVPLRVDGDSIVIASA